MQMRPEIQIQTAIRAMTEVVIPAIHPDEALAQEQAQIVVGILGLLAGFLPLEFRFDRDELGRLASTAGEVAEVAAGGERTADAARRLRDATAGGSDVLDRARAEPSELQSAVRELRAALGELIGAVYADGEPAARDTVQRAMLDWAESQQLRERSAALLQGFEQERHGVPPLEELLAPAPTQGARTASASRGSSTVTRAPGSGADAVGQRTRSS